MQLNLTVLQAAYHCPYKAWQLAKIDNTSTSQAQPSVRPDSSAKDKVIAAAWYKAHPTVTAPPADLRKLSKYTKQAETLLAKVESCISQETPPPFYRISHCSECQFKDSCYKQLKEKDCISLLAGMTPRVVTKHHKKGVTTITQLSYLFRPRRNRRKPQNAAGYLWELKALAVREQKTFVMAPPDVTDHPVSIFLDFEGLPDERFQYLLGGVIMQADKLPERFVFWSDTVEQEKESFQNLIALLLKYPNAPIYHYGSYESKAFKVMVKRYPTIFKREWAVIERRMINILGYFRTHVYPPTYGNGLKEIAGFLGYKWTDPHAHGLLSIDWRKRWEETRLDEWKTKLLQYNYDDCNALEVVHHWLSQLALGDIQENVQQVSKMKRHTPYRLQSNPEFGEDFQFITKAAYFNYQRDKIYWRNELKRQTPAARSLSRRPKKTTKGLMVWQPKRVNEVVIAPPVTKCPDCGSTKINQLKSLDNSTKQTDLIFTASGIRRHIRQYRSNIFDCYDCDRRITNQNLRMMHYGDNLFAFIVNYYVRYHLSNEMISKLIQEDFGIWISPMYLVMQKYTWWQKMWVEEAEYIRQIVLASPVIHIDETTIRLSKESGYVWVFATTHSVFYLYTQTRKADFLADLLKDYTGVIISDFYPGYDTLSINHQKCLIHLIRDLNDDLFKNPFDQEYKLIVTGFSKLLRSIIETIDRHGLQKKHLKKHIKQTERFYRDFVDHDHTSELSVQYVKRFKKHWDGLWTFLYHDGVPWNNNNAEAAVKAFAQHRRGVKGVMHERGLHLYLQMLSVEQTCRYRNISFLKFLRGKQGIWEHLPPDALPGYLPFKQARLYVRRLGFQRKAEWTAWDKAGNRPSFIPHTPNSAYRRKGWVSWHDWIGFSFLPFAKARTYMRKQKLRTRADYWEWLASGKRPKHIPRSPEKVYKHTGWKSLSDWLGTTKIRKRKIPRLLYTEAKAYMQSVGLRTQREFFEWRKSEKRPEGIPPNPNRVYPEFEGWGKFLGSGRVANQKRIFWDYFLAKAFLKILGVQSEKHFLELYESGSIPAGIPKNPYAYYKRLGTWVSTNDFYGK